MSLSTITNQILLKVDDYFNIDVFLFIILSKKNFFFSNLKTSTLKL